MSTKASTFGISFAIKLINAGQTHPAPWECVCTLHAVPNITIEIEIERELQPVAFHSQTV